jgi:hypothetical protein
MSQEEETPRTIFENYREAFRDGEETASYIFDPADASHQLPVTRFAVFHTVI